MVWSEGNIYPVTPPGIDPGTFRLVAQRLNHYPTPGIHYEIFAEGTRFLKAHYHTPIPAASRSKAWVCGRLLAGIVGSNPAGDIDVCILRVIFFCQVEVSALG